MKPSMQEGKRRALIVGVTGQDGILLARLLIQRGYQVLGTSRHQKNAIRRVEGFLVESPVAVVQMQPSDFRSVFSVVKNFKPSEIYNLAGQTSVSVSFDEPVETMESISHSNLIFLEVIRLVDASIRYYNAVSTDVFGNIPLGKSASEESPLNPRSPYGVAKSSAYWLVKNYRESYGLHLSNGILSNHESELRPASFVVPKIVEGAYLISHSREKTLSLGNVGISRDWGWAEDYVEAMWLMLQADIPGDYVIGTGRTVPLSYVLERSFGNFGLAWKDFVVADTSELRPSDIQRTAVDPTKAHRLLGWSASCDIDGVIDRLSESVDCRLRRTGQSQFLGNVREVN